MVFTSKLQRAAREGAGVSCLQACAGSYSGNSFAGNAKGSVQIDLLADLDDNDLAASNRLDKPIVLL